MTQLTRLTVSLTKHNAHKVARLLKDHPSTEVFERLPDVQAEAAQARKNLSVMAGDVLPPVWAKAQALGSDAIDALVLLAIVFSHHTLIEAMSTASERQGFSGRIVRDTQLSGKDYTNFVRVIDQLGYSTKLEYAGVSFNLKGMFEIPGLGPLVGELLELKLLQARWDRSNSLPEEATSLGFHKVFGISGKELRGWLVAGAQPAAAGTSLSARDEEFFAEETEGAKPKPFLFQPGHTERDVEPMTKSASAKSIANRLHNDIQNRLYTHLKSVLGSNAVGTEQDTGSGTAIDLVTNHDGTVTFYEIKTGTSVRASIRQALPQLLEYAYWPADDRAEELIIVSHLPATKAATRYLAMLRDKFGIPISYRQFELSTNKLI
jgi:hypothetical protein